MASGVSFVLVIMLVSVLVIVLTRITRALATLTCLCISLINACLDRKGTPQLELKGQCTKCYIEFIVHVKIHR